MEDPHNEVKDWLTAIEPVLKKIDEHKGTTWASILQKNDSNELHEFAQWAHGFLEHQLTKSPAAPAAPVTESREGEVLRPVYAPGGVLVTADEILKGLELALDRSYKMEGDKAYNYLYSTGQYATQVLRKMLAAAPVVESRPAGHLKGLLDEALSNVEDLRRDADSGSIDVELRCEQITEALEAAALALSPAPVATEGAGQADGWVPVGEITSKDKEEWLHVLMPDNEVLLGIYCAPINHIDDDNGEQVWRQWGECDYEVMPVQPTHFQPKPAAPLTPKANSRHA